MTVLAAGLAAAAVLLWRPTGRWWVRRRLGTGGTPGRWWIPPALLAALAGLPRLPQLSMLRLAVIGVAVGVAIFVTGQVWRIRDRERIAHRRRDALELVALMAAELRAGVLPSRLLTGLADDFAMLLPAARAAELGGDVAAALREAAELPGLELLRDLSAAWQVAERSGAPLVAVLTRVSEAARIQQDIVREAEAGVAPARATGRLMAVLPAMGLLLGSGMGGDPVGVLLGSWIGVFCLASGCALACLGVAWIDRIAASAVEI